jgi:tetratricopeptide (TPR) repeat protein
MQTLNRYVSVLGSVLLGGLLLASINGCAGGNPFVGEAESQLENRNYDQALVSVDSALGRTPQNAEVYMLKARILEQKASDSTAVSGPEEHVELIKQARDAREEALSINPGLRSDVQSRRQLAYIQEMQKGADAFNRGRQSQDQQAFKEAAAYFNAANIIMPDSSNAHLNEAYALINMGDQPAAIPPMEQYIETADSVDAQQYTLLGQLYLTNDRAENAIDLLTDASQQFPQNSDLQSLLLNAYQQTGQTQEAIRLYRSQVEQNPDNALYRYNLGSLLLNTQQYDEAIEQLTTAVDIAPDNPNAQYNLGAAYVNKAVAVNDEIRSIEDSLRANSEELSQEEVQQLDEEAKQLAEERRQLFEDAIPALEKAKELAEASGEGSVQRICDALYTAYVQTEQMEKARSVENCSASQ